MNTLPPKCRFIQATLISPMKFLKQGNFCEGQVK